MKILIVLIIWFVGCAKDNPIISFSGRTMGTTYNVVYVANDSKISKEKVWADVDSALESINNSMSTYKQNSELSQFNLSADLNWHKISDELYNVIKTSLEISKLSYGAFDITVGPLVNLWGFGPRKSKQVPTQFEIAKKLKNTGYQQLELDNINKRIRKKNTHLYLDLSGIAKGFGVDLAASALIGNGINSFIVEVGGEIRVRGSKNGAPWSIAIASPEIMDVKFEKILKIKNMNLGIATSGDYLNFYKINKKKYSHIIDPKTGRPIDNGVESVTILVEDKCMVADAWATAFMVLGIEDGKKIAESLNIPVFFIYKNNLNQNVEYSSSRFKKLFP